MNRQDFADVLAKIPLWGETAALIIGLDGGAALIGHSPPEKMFAEILSVPEDQLGRSNVNRLRSAWAGLDASRKRDLLRRHLAADAPDRQAVAFLAELWRGGYVRTIVASDPNQHLFDLLRKALAAELDQPLSCSLMTPNVIRRVAATPDRKMVFIDGSEMLIQGAALVPLYMPDPSEMSSAIREIAARFSRSFVWGWHERYNVSFASIWPARDIYALGAYTNLDTAYPYQQVEDPEDYDHQRATTRIFADLKPRLFPHGLSVSVPSLEARHPLETGTSRESASPPGTPPCLLWRDEDVRELLAQQEDARLLLAAVDGSLVRSRLAARIADDLRAKGKRCWQVPSDYESLLDEIAFAHGSSIDQCVILSIDGRVDDGLPQAMLISALDRWLKKTRASHLQLILIESPTLIQELQAWPRLAADSPEPTAVQVQSLRASACMNPAFIERWLDGLPLLQCLSSAQRHDLAHKMYDALPELPYASADAAVDRLHGALDFWYMELRDHQEKAEDAKDLSVPECLGTWLSLLNCLDDLMDFDLGTPKLRPPPAEEGAGGAAPQDADLDDFDLQPRIRGEEDEHA